MRGLPSKSVHCFVCDLPYGQLCETSVPWDVKLELKEFWTEVKRLAASDNSPVIMFCNTKFGFELYNSNPSWFRYDLVWNKERGTTFLLANKMPMKSHEMIYVFSKKGAFYRRVDIPGEYASWSAHERPATTRVVATWSGSNIAKGNDGTTRTPLSVITVRKPNTLGHPTEKPVELYRWILERYCPEGGVVLDPTAGSFNAIIAAKQLGLRGIGIEKNPDYFHQAIQRFWNQQ